VDSARERGSGPGIAAAAALLLLVCGANLRASDCANQIWLDKSGSPSRTELQSATPPALDLVRVFAGSDCGDRWQIFGFAGAAHSALPSYTVQIPHRPPAGCPTQPPKSEISVVFRPMAKDAEAQRQKECDAVRQNASVAYHNAIESQVSRAAESLATSTVPDSGRTCIVDLLYRLADTRSVRRALILTDGEETCLPAFRGPIPAPDPEMVVAMVIVSKRDTRVSPHTYYARMKEKWEHVAPWLRVVAPYEVGETIWKRK